jgi:cytochrome c oxidase subunit 2
MIAVVHAQLRYVYTRNPSIFGTAGRYAHRIEWLGWAMVVGALVILALVIGIIIAGLLRRHGRPIRGDEPAPEVSTTAWLLGGGTIMPIIVLAGIFISAVAVLGASERTDPAALEVEVIGHQWWWQVRYPQYGFESADEIHIPVGRSVRLRLTSADVIHSFWVPSLNGKTDLNPASENIMYIEADTAGVYIGRCAEYCGMQHAHMGVSVVAEDMGSFLEWVERTRAPARDPADSTQAAGLQAFLDHGCSSCHTIRGTPASGRIGPDLSHLGSRLTIAGATIANTAATLGGWIGNPEGLKPGTTMPTVPMDGGDLNAIVQYLESLR